MLHILLMILKIIGIVLLVILGIILSLLLIVLFVPIRYRVRGHKDEKELAGRARVSWFFGLLAFVVTYQEKQVDLQLKILGIDFMKLLKNRKQKEKKPKKNRDKISKIEDTKVESTETMQQEEKVPTAEDVPIQTISQETISENTSGDAVREEVQKPSTSTENKKNFLEKVKEFWNKLKGIPSKITGIAKKIKLTIGNICDKINYWKHFLADDRVKAALGVVKNQLFRILKHILPKKLKGQVTYGFEDPCTTGQVLAGVSVIYPLYYKHLSITPDFSGQVFLGNIDLKGRIYIFYLLKCGLAVLLNKNIQFIIHTFRNKEESENGKQ